jgi:hypothetical protein
MRLLWEGVHSTIKVKKGGVSGVSWKYEPLQYISNLKKTMVSSG